MARVLVLYGSTEGQAATVAERIADVLETAGHEPAVVHIKHRPEPFDLTDYDAVIVGASIHMGKHQKYVTKVRQKTRRRVESASVCVLLGEPRRRRGFRGGMGAVPASTSPSSSPKPGGTRTRRPSSPARSNTASTGRSSGS